MVNVEHYRIAEEPFYAPQGNEVTWYEAAYSKRLPVMVKGPTGCGMTKGHMVSAKSAVRQSG